MRCAKRRAASATGSEIPKGGTVMMNCKANVLMREATSSAKETFVLAKVCSSADFALESLAYVVTGKSNSKKPVASCACRIISPGVGDMGLGVDKPIIKKKPFSMAELSLPRYIVNPFLQQSPVFARGSIVDNPLRIAS